MRPIRTTIRYAWTMVVWYSAIGFFNGAVQAQPVPAEWYVDDDAPEGGDGFTWPTAFNSLQDAIDEAKVSFGSDLIKVAQGEYKPSVPSTPPETATFTIDFNEVTIEGGYAGIGAPNSDLRDIEAFETILNGVFPPASPPGSCGGPETLDCLVANPGVPGCQDPAWRARRRA